MNRSLQSLEWDKCALICSLKKVWTNVKQTEIFAAWWKEQRVGTSWPFHTMLSKRRKLPQCMVMMTTRNQQTDYIFQIASRELRSVIVWKNWLSTAAGSQANQKTMWSIWMMMWLAASENTHTCLRKQLSKQAIKKEKWGMILKLHGLLFDLRVFKKLDYVSKTIAMFFTVWTVSSKCLVSVVHNPKDWAFFNSQFNGEQ